MFDLGTFCETADCKMETIMQNLLKKVFQLTGAVNSMVQVAYEQKPNETNYEAVFEYCDNIAQQVGKIARYIFDFDKQSIADEKTMLM